MQNKKWFLIEIEILENLWDGLYKIGDKLTTPVFSSSEYHAKIKFNNTFSGSECPNFRIINCIKCDDFIMSPNRLKF